jgi:hypothetical protein
MTVIEGPSKSMRQSRERERGKCGNDAKIHCVYACRWNTPEIVEKQVGGGRREEERQ